LRLLGKAVDRTTVEKCTEAQAAYGGPARDPFTGAPYRERLGPVFNAALKSRIDRFLLGKFNRQNTLSMFLD
jgi:hypothetical protein